MTPDHVAWMFLTEEQLQLLRDAQRIGRKPQELFEMGGLCATTSDDAPPAPPQAPTAVGDDGEDDGDDPEIIAGLDEALARMKVKEEAEAPARAADEMEDDGGLCATAVPNHPPTLAGLTQEQIVQLLNEQKLLKQQVAKLELESASAKAQALENERLRNAPPSQSVVEAAAEELLRKRAAEAAGSGDAASSAGGPCATAADAAAPEGVAAKTEAVRAAQQGATTGQVTARVRAFEELSKARAGMRALIKSEGGRARRGHRPRGRTAARV